MIDAAQKLTVKHDANGVFTDHSQDSADYLRDDYSVTLDAATDYLYIGYSKPFGSFYTHFTTPNASTNEFTAEIFDGTTWNTVSISDETKGFTRSGFMFFAKAGMKAETIDGKEAFYIRLRPDVTHTATDIRGLNLVFSSDSVLKEEFFEIGNSSLLPAGENSHISTHVASRNMIIQRLRNKGYLTADGVTVEKLDQWDLIDIFEVRQAATFLALSKIFFNLSDQVDDHWWIKYREYSNKFEESMRLSELSIDSNNDGIDNVDETTKSIRVFRWRR